MDIIKKYGLGFFSILVIVICIFFLHNSLKDYFSSTTRIVGYALGRSIPYALIAFLSVIPLWKRLKGRRIQYFIFCVAVCLCVFSPFFVSRVIAESNQLSNTTKEIAQIAKNMEKDPSQLLEKEYSNEEYGELHFIMPLIKENYEFSEKMIKELEIAGSGLDSIFSPENLVESEKINRSKGIVDAYSAKISEYEKKYEEMIANLQEVSKKAFSNNPDMQAGFQEGFEKGGKKSRKLMREYFTIEKKVVQKMNAFLDFALAKLGTFGREVDELVFEKDEDAAKAEELMQDFLAVAQKEDKVVEKLERHRMNSLRKLKNLD